MPDPFFLSVQQGDLRLLMRLLSRDPSGINTVDESGQTILHCACARGEVDIVLHLIQQPECNFQAQDQVYMHTPLHVACLYDQERIVQELLKVMNSDHINMKDMLGWSALHHAARNGNIEVCRMLMSSGAIPSQANKMGKTPLHYATEHGHLPILTYLYDYVVSMVTPPILNDSVLDCPTLLHSAALNVQNNVSSWLQSRTFPPSSKYRRIVDFQDNRYCEQYPDEVAESRGHTNLKSTLQSYRQKYQEWIDDIRLNQVPLDRIKLCICGFPKVGKSAMRESLNRPHLQALLNRNVEETDEEDVERCTLGIQITSMNLSGKDMFSVWDFAGQIENFVTHQFFISTQSTVFTVLINLQHSLDEQRKQLMRWLGFIKMKNLGQITLSTGLLDIEKDTVPMPYEKRGLQCVPVIIVGSHYDLVDVDKRDEALLNVQSLVEEMKVKFKDHLEISAELYPLNCLRAITPEIRSLKDHLCKVRSNLLEVQPQYPKVMELVAKKIEELREKRKLKVMKWERIKNMVHEDVNKLLSERQLSYVLKCLTNAGVLVYIEHGALSNFVFINPGWLCEEVLGKALAPAHFPKAKIATVGSTEISEEVLRMKFTDDAVDKENVDIILELLQHFDLCYRVEDTFVFPALIETPLDPNMWQPKPEFSYCGRQLVCSEETDSFPPGFFSKLQVSVSASVNQVVYHFKGSFIVDAVCYQCLVQMKSSSTTITLTCRSAPENVYDAVQLLDAVQTQVGSLVRNICPTVFLKLEIPSSIDLKNHIQPHCYPIHDIVTGASDIELVSNKSGTVETITDLLYMGSEEYRRAHEGKQTKVAYIPLDTILSVQELLNDGDADWKDLARVINLEKYIQLLESQASNCTKLLLQKWAEKPRWTVNALLWALKQIKRIDVHNYIKARF